MQEDLGHGHVAGEEERSNYVPVLRCRLLGHVAGEEELLGPVPGEGGHLGHVAVKEALLGLVPREGGHLRHILGEGHRSAPAHIGAAAHRSHSRVCKDTILRHRVLGSGYNSLQKFSTG